MDSFFKTIFRVISKIISTVYLCSTIHPNRNGHFLFAQNQTLSRNAKHILGRIYSSVQFLNSLIKYNLIEITMNFIPFKSSKLIPKDIFHIYLPHPIVRITWHSMYTNFCHFTLQGIIFHLPTIPFSTNAYF